MKTGCVFNRNPSPTGRCIKDPNYNKIDDQCELIDNNCKVKTSQSEAKSLPPVVTLPPLPVKTSPKVERKTSPKVERKSIPGDKSLGKISGPISANYTSYNQKIFNFYGDAHYSSENTCKPCKDFTINGVKIDPNNSENCWDISRLLADVFTKASQEGKWIDFYIELPYSFKKSTFPSERTVKEQIEQAGYLYKLYNIFYNCLTGFKCSYNTTRFHYVDIRQEYKKLDLKNLTDEIKQMLAEKGQEIPQVDESLVNYEMYVTMRILQKALNSLQRMVMTNNMQENKTIEISDKLMKDLFFSGGKTMTGYVEPKNYRIFVLQLTSDNYVEDALGLMKDSMINQELMDALLPPSLIVQRRGKIMHKARAQLEALEQEGNGEMARKILEFLKDKYRANVDNSKIMDLWNSIMITYNGFTKSKFKKMSDVNMLLHKFMNEFENIQKVMGISITGFSLIMDAYTLARMFRMYNGENHIDSSRVIVYAGDNHIDEYNAFFQDVLKTEVIKYDPNKNRKELSESSEFLRCLDVDLKYFM